jgi:hypothetical protein
MSSEAHAHVDEAAAVIGEDEVDAGDLITHHLGRDPVRGSAASGRRELEAVLGPDGGVEDECGVVPVPG